MSAAVGDGVGRGVGTGVGGEVGRMLGSSDNGASGDLVGGRAWTSVRREFVAKHALISARLESDWKKNCVLRQDHREGWTVMMHPSSPLRSTSSLK